MTWPLAPPSSLIVRVGPYGYIPLGYQQVVNPAAAQGLPSIPPNATMALIAVESSAIRWRDDGTAPTASVGMPLAAGQEIQYSGNLAAFEFIGPTATVNVSYYA